MAQLALRWRAAGRPPGGGGGGGGGKKGGGGGGGPAGGGGGAQGRAAAAAAEEEEVSRPTKRVNPADAIRERIEREERKPKAAAG